MPGRLTSLAANRHKALLLRALWGSQPWVERATAANSELERHLEATFRWLCVAQDASRDGGVAGWFELLPGRWTGSYPETTGYIIPTFLALAEARSDAAARERALRMADWEADVQMDDGAVLSGVMGTPRGPAVFNTGQAIFGWLTAFDASADYRYADAARSAADWLIRNQDADGAWRRNLSMLTTGTAPIYNNRCAWALAFAGTVLGEERYQEAARANSDWVLTQQNEAGWFANAAFADNQVPLLHTISYVIEGLLGVYTHTGDRRYVEACKRAIDPIVALWRAGEMAGRLDSQWRPTVSWRCVTGDAQIAVVLQRLEAHFPGTGYADTAHELNQDLARMQLRIAGSQAFSAPGSGRSAPAVGGVPGSFPIWGGYMRFAFPNWAAKFYLDSLLIEVLGIDELPARARPTYSSGQPAT